jgi:hypothetical protein
MFFSLMHKTTNQRRGATRVRTLVRRDPAKLQLPAPQRQITVILDLIWCIAISTTGVKLQSTAPKRQITVFLDLIWRINDREKLQLTVISHYSYL